MKSKNYIFLLNLMVYSLLGVSVHGQTVEILFEEGRVKVASIKDMEARDIQSCRTAQDQLLRLFYTYYFPVDLEEYKSIFHDDSWPANIEENYDLWRSNMEGVSIQVNSIYSALYNGQQTSILNFNFKKRDLTLRMSFFAKRIEGRWVPYEATELMQMNGMRAFFPIVKKEVFEAWTGEDVSADFAAVASELKGACGGQSTPLSHHCVYQKAEDWGISDDLGKQAMVDKLFEQRIVKANEPPIDVAIENVRQVFEGNEIDTRDLKVIAYYLNRGETMTAYHKIQSLAPELAFDVINERMQPTLGERALDTRDIKFTDNENGQ